MAGLSIALLVPICTLGAVCIVWAIFSILLEPIKPSKWGDGFFEDWDE